MMQQRHQRYWYQTNVFVPKTEIVGRSSSISIFQCSKIKKETTNGTVNLSIHCGTGRVSRLSTREPGR